MARPVQRLMPTQRQPAQVQDPQIPDAMLDIASQIRRMADSGEAGRSLPDPQGRRRSPRGADTQPPANQPPGNLGGGYQPPYWPGMGQPGWTPPSVNNPISQSPFNWPTLNPGQQQPPQYGPPAPGGGIQAGGPGGYFGPGGQQHNPGGELGGPGGYMPGPTYPGGPQQPFDPGNIIPGSGQGGNAQFYGPSPYRGAIGGPTQMGSATSFSNPFSNFSNPFSGMADSTTWGRTIGGMVGGAGGLPGALVGGWAGGKLADWWSNRFGGGEEGEQLPPLEYNHPLPGENRYNPVGPNVGPDGQQRTGMGSYRTRAGNVSGQINPESFIGTINPVGDGIEARQAGRVGNSWIRR